jgi:predicted phosphohydrolase
MKIFAIGDLHLALATPGKAMDFFGGDWKDYTSKIETNWRKHVSQDDLVLIPGDISWAKTLEEAKVDFAWIENLPGKKIISKGNHDYWWPSGKKLQEALPPSITALNKSALSIEGVSIAATKLYDAPGIFFGPYINFAPNPREVVKEKNEEEEKRLYQRELERLELALSMMPEAALRIAMVHYPPISADMTPSLASKLLEKYRIDICIFGHLHSIKKECSLFGKSLNGVKYYLTSADYLDFCPLLIKEI